MLYNRVIESTTAVQERSKEKPVVALILGSGLGDLANELENVVAIPYEEIPHFVRSTVTGHAGRLLIGRLEQMPVVVMQGRVHYYEGYTLQEVTLPVRVMSMLGARTLFVSNAAGGVNPTYRPGDFMLIRDHISLPGMVGANPLVGPNDERLGERFLPMGNTYDVQLRGLVHSVAQKRPEVTLHEGIYTMVSGPNYETPAELRFLRTIGTDAVGMSTVPEVVVARHMGMRVVGMSLITNAATGSETQAEVSHAEVLATSEAVRPNFAALVRGIVQAIANFPA